jgi:hypothetical protein
MREGMCKVTSSSGRALLGLPLTENGSAERRLFLKGIAATLRQTSEDLDFSGSHRWQHPTMPKPCQVSIAEGDDPGSVYI